MDAKHAMRWICLLWPSLLCAMPETWLSDAGIPDLDQAIIQQQRLVKEHPDHASHHFRMHQLLLAKKQWIQAQEALEQARALRLSDRLWKVPMGRIHLARHNYEAVLQNITLDTEWLADDAWAQELQVLRGHAHAALGHTLQAKRAYQSVVQNNPAWEEAWLGWAQLEAQQGAYEEALRLLHEATQQCPGIDGLKVAVLEATVLHANNDFESAYYGFGEALAREPRNPTALMGMTQLLALAEIWDEFEVYAEALHQRLPQHSYAQWLHALAAYQKHQGLQAQQWLQEVVVEEPRRREAYVLLAAVFHDLEQPEEARAVLDRLLAFQPHDPENHYYRLALAVAQNDEAYVAQSLERLAAQKNDHPWWYVFQAQHALMQNKTDVIWQAYDQLVSVLPHPERQNQLLGVQGRDLMSLPLPQQEIAFLRNTMVAFPLIQAMALAQQGDHEGAREAYQKLLHGPYHAVAAYGLGQVAWAQGEQTLAVDWYKQAVQAPQFTQAGLALADAWSTLRMNDQAIETLHHVLAEQPNHVVAMQKLLALDRRDQLHEKTRALLQQQAQTETDHPNAGIALAVYYLQTHQEAQAKSTTDALLKRFPEHTGLLEVATQVALRDNHPEEAERHLKILLRQQPKNASVVQRLVEVSLAQNELSQAQHYLTQVLRLDPDNLGNLWLKAQLLQRKQAYNELVAVAQNLVKKEPKSRLGHEMLAEAYMGLGVHEQSVYHRDRAYHLEPNSQTLLAWVRAEWQVALDPTPAAERLVRWLDEHPEDTIVRMALAQHLMHHHHLHDAVAHYEKVLLTQPQHLEAIMALARAYSDANPERALLHAEKAFAMAPNLPAVQSVYGWTLVQQGRLKQGKKYLQQALNKDPTDLEGHYHHAVALYRLGDHKKAHHSLIPVIQKGQQEPYFVEAKLLFDELQHRLR